MLELQRMPVVKTSMLIRKPVQDVFEAFADPSVTTMFWFTKGSGRLEAGRQVRWEWEMYGVADDVTVEAFIPHERIALVFGDGTAAEWLFEDRGPLGTLVTITADGFHGGADEAVEGALDAMGGYTMVLCAAKAYLEHGVRLNVVADRAPDANVTD